MRRACLAVATAVFVLACGPGASEAEPVDGLDLDDIDLATVESEIATGARVCSWNIRRLGHAFDNRPKDMAVTASVIRRNCDVVAVQEVMQTGGEAPGHAALLQELGPGWVGAITARPQPDDPVSSSSEHYAFYVRKTRGDFCNDWAGVEQLRDDEGAFQREPAWACIRINGRAKELLLVSYHAVFGSIAERRREVGALDDDLNHDGRKDDLVRAVRASRPDEADVVIVGDFNLTPSDIAAVLPTWTDFTTGTGSTLNADDGITSNLYDHVLFPSDQPDVNAVAPAKVLDVRGLAKGDTFFRSVSDHLPIRFTLRGSAPAPQ